MLKKCKVVTLPTNEKALLQYIPESKSLAVRPYDRENPHNIIDNLGIPQHLYILSDEDIQVGDWVYLKHDTVSSNKVQKVLKIRIDNGRQSIITKNTVDFVENYSKVIASTNPSLYLPSLSNAFIAKYCKKGGIDQIMVQYDTSEFLKVSSDNTITIKSIKDTYSKEEVRDLLLELWDDVKNDQVHFDQDVENWIKENL